MDMCDLESIKKAVQFINDPIDALVLNAGGNPGADLTPHGYTKIFGANMLGHVLLTRSLITAKKLKGSVVYSATEAARGVPQLGAENFPWKDFSVEEIKSAADG